MRFKEYLTESEKTWYMRVGNYHLVIFGNRSKTLIEAFNEDGDFLNITEGPMLKLALDIWKDAEELPYDEYKELYPKDKDADGDFIVFNTDKNKIKKLSKMLDIEFEKYLKN